MGRDRRIRRPHDVGRWHDSLRAMGARIRLAVERQGIVATLGAEVDDVDLADGVGDVAVLAVPVGLRIIRAGDAAVVERDAGQRGLDRRRHRFGGRERRRGDGQRVVLGPCDDVSGNAELPDDATGHLHPATPAPARAPGVLAQNVAFAPADRLHSVVGLLPAGVIEDAAAVAHEDVVGGEGEGHRASLIHGTLHVEDALVVGALDYAVGTDSMRLEPIIRHGPSVPGITLRRASWRRHRRAPVVREILAGEVGVASCGGNAGVRLDVVVDEVLPTSLTSVVRDCARHREAAREHGRIAAEGGVRLDAQAAVQRTQGSESPAAAASALVVNLADHARTLRPSLARVESRWESVPAVKLAEVLLLGALGKLARLRNVLPAEPRLEGRGGLIDHPVLHLHREALLRFVPRLSQGLGHHWLGALHELLRRLNVVAGPILVRVVRLDHAHDEAVLECDQLRMRQLVAEARLVNDVFEELGRSLRHQAATSSWDSP
mmetsp:Transcript_58854/g.192007  ORF Transcript_58854/g.192007 Transcript_58854/m.192007 type:complete len:491 (+) Transcript_58854:514-1986(+)